MKWWKKPDNQPPPHEHHVKCVGVDHQTITAEMAGPFVSAGVYTHALLRCECGEILSRTVRGKFTVEQVNGITADDMLRSLTNPALGESRKS